MKGALGRFWSNTRQKAAERVLRDTVIRKSDQSQTGLLRVLLIAPPMQVVGGQSVQADRLYSCLRGNPALRITFQPTVFALRLFHVDLGRLRYIRTVLNSLIYLCSLLGRIPRNDVIHVFTAGYASFLLIAAPALVLSRLFFKKVILHYHDGRALDHLERALGAPVLCRLADAIVTPTTFLVEVFARFGLKARPIPNILDARAYPFRLRRHPRPVFFHNRGLESEYNVECTLRAFANIQQRYPEARLVVAHDGSLRQRLEAAARSLQLRNVTFTGAVSQDRIRDLYDSADIYLSSANYDNMPGSVLEAFAAGLPVIATRAGGTAWIVRDQHNGLLVNCGDHQAMAAAAFRLLEEPGLAERLASAARRDLTRYSWANIGWKWVDLYSNLAPVRNRQLTPAAEASEYECSNR